MALWCVLLQGPRMKRSNPGHSHERNRNRNGLGEQAALLQALLQVLYLLMLSTRMPVLDGTLGCSDSFPEGSRKESMLLRPTFEGLPPQNSCTRMLLRMLQFFSSGTQERQFRDPGEHMGLSFSLSLLAGGAAWWGQGQSERGCRSRTCGVSAGKG